MSKNLWRGIVRHVTMRAEYEGKVWRSVAYFSLDGQPARLVCDDLPPCSRTALPAPFELGDPMIVFGKLNPREGRLDVSVARLIRQGKTINCDGANAPLLMGFLICVMALAFVPRIFFPQDNFARFIILSVVYVMMSAGVWFLTAGYRRLKARRLVEKATFDS